MLTGVNYHFSPKAYLLFPPRRKFLRKKQIDPGISSRLARQHNNFFTIAFDTPPSVNPTLTNIFTRTEQDLISVTTPGRNTYSNVTLQQKSALNNLKKFQSIVIKSCDKDGVMNTKDYLTKIYTHLQDRNTYKPLTSHKVQ